MGAWGRRARAGRNAGAECRRREAARRLRAMRGREAAMDTRDLKVFVAVYETKSITRAAKASF